MVFFKNTRIKLLILQTYLLLHIINISPDNTTNIININSYTLNPSNYNNDFNLNQTLDILQNIPQEILIEIFSFLKPEEIFQNLSLVKKEFHQVSKTNYLCKQLLLYKYGKILEKFPELEKKIMNNKFNKSDYYLKLIKKMPDILIDSELTYQKKGKIIYNKKISKIIDCIQITDEKILIVSIYNNIGILNINTQEYKPIFLKDNNHKIDDYYKIECILNTYDGKHLIAGLRNGDIVIWNLNNKKCEAILKGHTGSIECLLKLKNGKIASGSADTTIRIWNLDEKKCEKVLTEHKNVVSCLEELEPNIIISGSYDKKTIKWDLNKENPLIKDKTQKGGLITCLKKINNEKILIRSFNKKIRILNSKELTELKILTELTELTNHNPFKTNVFLKKLKTGNMAIMKNNTIKIFNLNNNKTIQTLKGKTSYAKILNDDRIFTQNDDGKIMIWDYIIKNKTLTSA